MKIPKLSHFIWILPFLTFCIGYITFEFVFSEKQVIVPQIVGKSLTEGMKILSGYKINGRILAEKEDGDLPEGTILEQKPSNSKIKPYQSVHLIISKKPSIKSTPDFSQKYVAEIKRELLESGQKCRTYYFKSTLPRGIILSQNPQPNAPQANRVDLFVSSGSSNLYVMPNLKNKDLAEVIEFLDLNNVKYSIVGQNFGNATVLDQKPLAGSIVKLTNLHVHIKI